MRFCQWRRHRGGRTLAFMIVQRLDHVNIITNRLADTARFCGAARDHRVLRLGCLLVLGDDKAKTNWEDRQRRVSAIWRGY